MDVWEYFQDRLRECRQLSIDPDLEMAEEQGSHGQRGILLGFAHLNDHACVRVHERVRVLGSGIHREKYAYYLLADSREIGGYERDPTHEPIAEHRHCSHRKQHERQPAEGISFKQAVELAWQYLAQQAERRNG